jgi:hypothetical protein
MPDQTKITLKQVHEEIGRTFRKQQLLDMGIQLIDSTLGALDSPLVPESERRLLTVLKHYATHAEHQSALIAVLSSMLVRAGVLSADTLGEAMKLDPQEIVKTADAIEAPATVPTIF